DERTIFKGTISALEAVHGESQAANVTVFAEDKLMRLRMTRRAKTYLNMSDADIASALAGEHGFQPDTAADGPTYDVVQQWNQSDASDEESGNEALQGGISGGRTGPSVLESALGDRVSQRVRDVPIAATEARAFAKGEMLHRGRAFVTAVGTTSGTPDLVVGSRLTLQAVGRPFEGDGYYVTRVAHAYDLRSGH